MKLGKLVSSMRKLVSGRSRPSDNSLSAALRSASVQANDAQAGNTQAGNTQAGNTQAGDAQAGNTQASNTQKRQSIFDRFSALRRNMRGTTPPKEGRVLPKAELGIDEDAHVAYNDSSDIGYDSTILRGALNHSWLRSGAFFTPMRFRDSASEPPPPPERRRERNETEEEGHTGKKVHFERPLTEWIWEGSVCA